MFRWLRYAALFAVGVARRFYANAPQNGYEAILFNYIKAVVAQIFFREAARIVTEPQPEPDPGEWRARKH